ncbi:MAG: type II secretion system protein [Phycisphaerales bacterium]|nr:type II secretion system protein [Phycisphaerales bacterium]
MLEVVAAVAILAIITATVAIGLNYMVARNARERRQLAAMEMANRLVLMYMDDKNAMPSRTLPLPYAGEEYMYSMHEDKRVELNDSPTVAAALRAATRGGISRDRLEVVRIRVWLHKDLQGREYAPDTAPSATLARIYDPLNITRNPDSGTNAINTEQGLRDVVNQVLNGSNNP